MTVEEKKILSVIDLQAVDGSRLAGILSCNMVGLGTEFPKGHALYKAMKVGLATNFRGSLEDAVTDILRRVG